MNKAASSCTADLMSCELSGPGTYKHIAKAAVLSMNQIKYYYVFTVRVNCSCILLDPAKTLIILFDVVVPQLAINVSSYLLFWPFAIDRFFFPSSVFASC